MTRQGTDIPDLINRQWLDFFQRHFGQLIPLVPIENIFGHCTEAGLKTTMMRTGSLFAYMRMSV
jgi:hypothetical protein